MKFGKIENPETIDFTLPEDHPETQKVLAANTQSYKIVALAALNGASRI